jgi:alpha-tubulin suppressor-like RCC1 family protein
VEAFRAYGAKAKAVSCSAKNTFVLTTDGEVLGCGSGEYGRLGTGVSADSAVPTPVAALADHTIVQIASAYSHTLALTDKGEVFVWGRNDSGQLGLDGSFIDIYSMEEVPRSISPKAFQGESDQLSVKVVRIAAAKGRSAAVTEDGRVFLWGHRVYHVPKLVEAPVLSSGAPWKAVDVACGGDISKSCTAITTDGGHLWTFGGSDTLLGVSKSEPERATALRKSMVSSPEAKSVPRLVTENILPDYKVTKVALGLTHGAALVVGRG